MDEVLAVEGLSKRYGDREALRGVCLSLAAGECLGLLGPNGAGKTSLVRAIAGRVRPDEGRITLLGRSLEASAREGREELGVVPQEIALYPALTAGENLRVFGALQGLAGPRLAERVDWALGFTGLETRRDDRVETFSGGMKRRLNIACSVLHHPRVVLLDEPTVGVDPQSRERIWHMLQELRRDGASLVLTTHQLDEAETQCDRIVIIDHGRVIADGTLGELIAHTLGPHRRVRVVLDGPWTGALPPGFSAEGTALVGEPVPMAQGLGRLLESLPGAGREALDVQVERATLQSVFIHLTGRELRE